MMNTLTNTSPTHMLLRKRDRTLLYLIWVYHLQG